MAEALCQPRTRRAKTRWSSGRTTRQLTSSTIRQITITTSLILPAALSIAAPRPGNSQRITSQYLRAAGPPPQAMAKPQGPRHLHHWLQGSTVVHRRANRHTLRLTFLPKCPHTAIISRTRDISSTSHQTCSKASVSRTNPPARLELGCTARTTAL